VARMPAAEWVGEQSPRTPMSRYDVVCIHTIVGYAPAHAAHFSTTADGQLFQSRDTAYRSAANLDGNHRVLAIENEDHGEAFGHWEGSDVPPLTDAQVDKCAEVLAWAHKVHGIPLQLCPDSKAGSRGLAYHRQGIDGDFGPFDYPGRVPGGEVWTESYGKVCPGDLRIAQLPEILAIAQGKDPDVGVELDDDIYRDDAKEVSLRGVLQRLDKFLATNADRQRALLAEFAEIHDAVDRGLDRDQVKRLLDRLERRLLAELAVPEQDQAPSSG
jgi:hypothetical protein